MQYRPRQRMLFLGVVNGLILIHVLAYYVFDRREIGCIDFFGITTFAGNGQVTAGTVFLVGLIVLTLLLGRIFCGWGCHFALFQDLLFRLFDRMGLRPHFRRSRLERVIPPILLKIAKIDITRLVKYYMDNPDKNHGIVIGSLTGKRRGLFTLQQGFGQGVYARIRYMY